MARCEILNLDGGCTEVAVRRFVTEDHWGNPGSLWACQPCAVWWRTRHPELTGEEPPSRTMGDTG